jgi:hypothetical protein
MNIKKPIDQKAMQRFSQARMRAWENLPTGFIPWETFKRLTNQFGISKACIKAQNIIDKQSKKV